MENTAIQFTITLSKHLGYVLAAQTSRGLCALYLGDTPKIVRDELHRAFPRAQFDPHNLKLCNAMTQISNYLTNTHSDLNIGLDLSGTIFQKSVWNALQTIPIGQTATYATIANKLGCPKSYRAVASACASNKISIIIPCHRVIKSNGHLSGYRWGVHRKEILLRQEKQKR